MKAPSIPKPGISFVGNASSDSAVLESFESRLNQDLELAMSEGSQFFENRGSVQQALKNITSRLAELGIDYAVVGGMALFGHGFRRFTEDVDLLVTREGLKKIHQRLEGSGYLPPFPGSKNLRDTENGVKIEFLVSGDYPGDGKPKPVSFPDPTAVSIEKNGIRYINLPTLIELKLASGISNSDRIKDLADVLELIKLLQLPLELSERLNPFVQGKYRELWEVAHPTMKRFVRLLKRDEFELATSFNAAIDTEFQSTVDTFKAMLADGVSVDSSSTATGQYVRLLTTNPDVARKYEMHEESELLEPED